MDRLSALDVSFLTNESSSAHMHVGGIMIFEGPPPAYDDLLEHIRSRLHLVPRFRQKLAYPPVPTGRPFWIDDPAFNLEYHVRHSALPSPGSEEQLRNMAARVFSQQLDRTKPLWELWMVQGLTRKRFALVTKTHHALVDGVSGVDIATVLFDVKPVPEPSHPEHEWIPGPGAVGRPAAGQGCRGASEHADPTRAPARARDRASSGGAATGRRGGRGARRGGLELRQPGAGPAAQRPDRLPPPLRVGSQRPGAVQADQGRARRHGQRRRPDGGQRSHAALASVARRAHRGPRAARPGAGLDPGRPTSTASSATRSRRCARPLPVYIEDPVQRLNVVRQAMEGVKQSKQALGAEVISRFNDFAPPTLLAQSARVNFSTRLFNLVVTNVPGPQIPLYVLGRELEDIFPVGFLPPESGACSSRS